MLINIRPKVLNDLSMTLLRQYSSSVEIPHSKGLPFFGTALSLLAAGGAPKLHRYIDARHKQFGPIFKEKIGPVSAVFISDADMMRAVFAQEGKYPVHLLPESWVVYNRLYGCSRGLFFMDGEEWHYHRKALNKLSYSKSKDSDFVNKSCVVTARNLINKWRLSGDKISNLEADFYRWSIDTLVAVLVGDAEYVKVVDELNTRLDHLAVVIIRIFKYTSQLSLLPANLVAAYNLPIWQKFVASVDDALVAANELVAEFLTGSLNKDHLLAKMMAEKMIHSDITRIVVDMILAAGDTTAYTMQWLLYSIATRQDLQKRLLQTDGELLAKDIIKETLRMYPVAPFLTRILPNECTLSDYVIPPKQLIIMSIFTSGMSPKYFVNPEQFLPDRWTRRSDNSVGEQTGMKQASLPFAMGARSCIGRRLAETQLSTLLLQMVRSYRIELSNNVNVEIILKMIAVPSKPIQITLIPR